ncbi:polysaccharide pyruvyl transferase family protein [Ornithobacterium rhinotracheale]|uniref:polysaccharide pyruvyl transferase family protein n=1 Tax=Ornithobacterium rhinotracheale TaxID=28251 RepID=UPI00403678B1
MSLGKHKLYRKIHSLKMYFQPNFSKALKVNWFKSRNFGDALNPVLLKYITGEDSVCIAPEFYKKENLSCIGSILQTANEGTIVWGSGFLNQSNGFAFAAPKLVKAVRGPKSMKKLHKLGVECPEVFGDPALLLSKYFNPKIEKKYKFGIIPHYINWDDKILEQYKNNPDVIVINVMQKDPLNVVKEIISCEKILSSSLHGIIISDTYKIPSQWIKLSKDLSKDDFKFYDYAQGVGKEISPIELINQKLEDIIIDQHSFDINFDSDKLLNNFPILK